jgi:hypothetical protein
MYISPDNFAKLVTERRQTPEVEAGLNDSGKVRARHKLFLLSPGRAFVSQRRVMTHSQNISGLTPDA